MAARYGRAVLRRRFGEVHEGAPTIALTTAALQPGARAAGVRPRALWRTGAVPAPCCRRILTVARRAVSRVLAALSCSAILLVLQIALGRHVAGAPPNSLVAHLLVVVAHGRVELRALVVGTARGGAARRARAPRAVGGLRQHGLLKVMRLEAAPDRADIRRALLARSKHIAELPPRGGEELGLALDEHGLGFLDPLLLLDELIRPVDVLSHVVHLRLERHVRGGGVARTGLAALSGRSSGTHSRWRLVVCCRVGQGDIVLGAGPGCWLGAWHATSAPAACRRSRRRAVGVGWVHLGRGDRARRALALSGRKVFVEIQREMSLGDAIEIRYEKMGASSASLVQ